MASLTDSLVFLIAAHTDVAMFQKLTNALQPFRVVAHIDRKSNEKDFRSRVAPNVEFVSKRHRVNWAGFSQVKAIESMINHASDVHPDTYLCLLTGQDYPARSPRSFAKALASSGVPYFVRSFEISSSSEKYTWQVQRRHYQDLGARLPRPVQRGTIALARTVNSKRPAKIPSNVRLAHGQANWVVRRSVADQVLSHLGDPDMRKLLQRTFAPDEKFVPTILRSSVDFSENVEGSDFVGEGNWRYTNFHYIDPSLRVLDIRDYDAIRASGKFFARKVTSTQSASLTDALERSWDH